MNNYLFNAKNEIKAVIGWIQEWFEKNGPTASAVIGISGGKDSTIVAKLCTEALGPDRVIGVLMPNGEQADIGDAIRVAELLGIKHITVNINETYDVLNNALDKGLATLSASEVDIDSEDRIINIPPRLRMTTLYAIAQSLPNGGRVANTCNLSEDYIGYSTKYGDSAGDFSPCGNFTVTEMLEIGDELGLPAELVHKTPSDGLCGLSDEVKLGFTYADLDVYIRTGKCENKKTKDRIDRLHKINFHKLMPMPTYQG